MEEGTEAWRDQKPPKATRLGSDRAVSRARPLSPESNEQRARHFLLPSLPGFLRIKKTNKNLNMIYLHLLLAGRPG